ncbi:hypothetical protein SAICODRAFT_107493 [Saitoella complicata NRRL Y-17804]|uniref:Uncharacterized protein n=1 Tax=Saitoella complicata (strain BCRC 22490 / CBS 7301 / JCM 7358 / NBRC 10748 / NRRL Y-17804) TaxID=698492 RepID=A0A0E9NN44_SAICN|nr:uncharacterized protein SAICODRAFT_107493 [Saitoella complicata NRRL Y-17804]ODQ56362.1 hypothetical protein SAICODRAFT_107493 [Saitoella complicata NRRL Y-17804]GAO50840.1 hypothetical protein G7K_4960-t1 [Saitoella complicata NRRL Y-17804]
MLVKEFNGNVLRSSRLLSRSISHTAQHETDLAKTVDLIHRSTTTTPNHPSCLKGLNLRQIRSVMGSRWRVVYKELYNIRVGPRVPDMPMPQPALPEKWKGMQFRGELAKRYGVGIPSTEPVQKLPRVCILTSKKQAGAKAVYRTIARKRMRAAVFKSITDPKSPTHELLQAADRDIMIQVTAGGPVLGGKNFDVPHLEKEIHETLCHILETLKNTASRGHRGPTVHGQRKPAFREYREPPIHGQRNPASREYREPKADERKVDQQKVDEQKNPASRGYRGPSIQKQKVDEPKDGAL